MTDQREWITLNITRMSDQHQKRLRADPDLFVAQFTQEMMNNGFLPWRDEVNDISNNWMLTHEDNQPLNEEKKIREECRENENLLAHPEMTGAALEAIRRLRLKAELQKLRENGQILGIDALVGRDIPDGIGEGCLLSLEGNGFKKGEDVLEPVVIRYHEVEIYFPYGYPDDPPLLKMKTPCFHPNISESDGRVCIREATTAYTSTYGLVEFVETLKDMIGYRKFNPSDPFNEDAVVFALARPDKIRAIGGKPLVENAVEPERVRDYLRWLHQGGQKGNVWALKRWLETGEPPKQEARIELLP